jgi:hypothetical protein
MLAAREKRRKRMSGDQALIPANPTAMDLLSVALKSNAAIDVIERLAALQEKAVVRQAEVEFNDAMTAAQSEMGRVAPNAINASTHSKWATYAELDRVLRPIYIRNGFSVSFNSGPSPIPEMVLVECYLSHRGGHTRKYQAPLMPADGKGAKGGDVMTKTFATGSAMSYGARYLLKFVFNVAVGEDDPEATATATNGELQEQVEWIANAKDPEELKKLYAAAYGLFESNPNALKVIIEARKARKKEQGW